MDSLLKECAAQTTSMLLEYQDIAKHENHSTDRHPMSTGQTLLDCGTPILNLITRQALLISKKQGDIDLIQQRLNDLISLATDKFYSYPFKDVSTCWRILYTDASILKVCSSILQPDQSIDIRNDSRPKNDWIEEVVKNLDMAMIMSGAPGTGRKEWIEKILDLLHPICEITDTKAEPSQKRRKLNNPEDIEDQFPTTQSFIPPIHHPISQTSNLSLPAFQNHMHQPPDPNLGPTPLIIKNPLTHWPALNERPWNRPSYLLSQTLGGRRLVPIEIGRSYVDENWGQKILPFKDFLEKYIINEQSHDTLEQKTGYLAQHELFTQIPSLRSDISIPDYCYIQPPPPHPSSPLASQHSAQSPLTDPVLNAWFGPAKTISPLHVDPYHNILCQVVGQKYIRLYAPKSTKFLHAKGIEDGGVDMGNTSGVDVGVMEGWDEGVREGFEGFGEVEFVEGVLGEGDCLYIPVGWWHYVRSLSVSFSVSFWWND